MAEFNKNVEKVNIEEVNIKNVVGNEQPTVEEQVNKQILDILSKIDSIQKNYKDDDSKIKKDLLNYYNELLSLIKTNINNINSNKFSIEDLYTSLANLEDYINRRINILTTNLNGKGTESLPIYITSDGVATPIKRYEGTSNKANYLTTNGGTGDIPVYFTGGIPKACNYNLKTLNDTKANINSPTFTGTVIAPIVKVNNNLTSPKGTITALTSDNITVNTDITSPRSTITNLNSTTGTITNLNSTTSYITNLTSTTRALGDSTNNVATTKFVTRAIGSSGPVFENGKLKFPNGNLLWIG